MSVASAPLREHWICQAQRLLAAGEDFVAATIIAAQGSSPQPPGGKMLITADAAHGTVGGGKLELEAIAAARELLRDNGGRTVRIWSLGAAMGQCCGGKVALLLERCRSAAPAVAVFGLGHVGREVAGMLSRMPYRVFGVDSRGEAIAACDGDIVRLQGDIDRVPDLPAGAHALIMTHSHQLDLDLCRAALERGDFGSVGVIGSRSKAASFRAQLSRRGLDGDSLLCPLGETGGRHPAEIAAAIVAEAVGRVVAGEATSAADAEDDKAAIRLLEEL